MDRLRSPQRKRDALAQFPHSVTTGRLTGKEDWLIRRENNLANEDSLPKMDELDPMLVLRCIL